jgi:FG-GAP-like repeat/Divergent InlB B-repeat domain
MKTLLLLINRAASGWANLTRFLPNSTTTIAIAALGLASVAMDASAQTAFYYSSPAGEVVGGGRTRTFNAPADSITVSANGLNGINATISEVRSGSSSTEVWYIGLAAPYGKVLAPGAYEGAISNAYNSPSPTVNMYGTGNCGTTKGRFNILTIAYATDGTLASLAANFSQQCNGSALALVAEIRFNSSIPLTTATAGLDTSPDPFALVMQSPVDAGASVTSLTTMVYGVNAPTPISIANGEYKVNDGAFTSTSSTVQNTDRVTVRVTASTIAGGTVAPVLTIGDRSATTSVTTYLLGIKLSGVRITSAPNDNVGRGVQRLFLAPFDLLSVFDGYFNSISVNTNGRDGVTLSFQIAPPAGSAFVVGQYYENAKRFPFQDTGAGLDVSMSGGCSQIAGRFIVRELIRNTSGAIDSLAVDFEQNCDGSSSAPLLGEVRINSSFPFTNLPLDIRYALKINKVGRGSGTVTALSGELSCGFACTVYLPLGWNLSLAAIATTGSVFKGWEDNSYQGCYGALPCSFQVTSSRIINARFEMPTKLTVLPTGLGSGSVFSTLVNGSQINCPSTCTADFDLDTTIVLNANAGFGSVFTGWSGGGCSGESPCTVTMNVAKTVQANFVPGYILSVTTDQVYGAGKVVSIPVGIDCGTACRAVVSPSGSVTLTASPNVGSQFVGWSGDSCSGIAPCIVVMNQARNIKATFVAVPRRITVGRAGTGDGVVTSTNGTIVCGNTCDASFSPAVGIELIAIPVQGSTFVGWSGGCTGSGNCIISQTNDVTVIAIFNRLRVSPNRTSDFDGDGKSDLLIQSAAGATTAWLMNGTTIASSAELIGINAGWTATHISDFNGDGKADILWRHTDGRIAMWLMNGTTFINGAGLLEANSGWTVTHVADFNGDGRADILFRHIDGRVAMWLMNGIALTSGAGLLNAASGWTVTHTGDFNGDGKADILFSHTDGRIAMWLMNGTALTSGAGLLNAASGWTVTHTGDFNGDGKADILFRHTDGRIAMWLMNGTALTSGGGLLNAASGWTVTHTGDFNGDGKADILFSHTDGRVAMWLMNGITLTSGAGLLNANSGWSVTHTGDFNGDGNSDLLLRQPDGSIAVWLMNGIVVATTSALVGAGTLRVVP